MNTENAKPRLLATYVTPNAYKICEKIARRLPYQIEIKKLSTKAFYNFFKKAFEFDGIIAVMATGIVVRGIAPFIKSKVTDPAVVVIDEKGRYVISLLSGHLGGANRLTEEIALILSAHPVITTATDVNELPSIDVYASDRNYGISDLKLCKKVSMAILKGETIPVFVESGEPKKFFKQQCFSIVSKKEFLQYKGLKIAVSTKDFYLSNTLFLIPRKLVLGTGFHRGTDKRALFEFIESNLKERGFFLQAVKSIATIDKRSGEEGFLSLCEEMNVKPLFFSEEALASVNFLKQSEVVKKYHFSGNIAEAAAFLGSNGGRIIVPKIKGGNITLCVAKEKSL